jgi:hypothetical protein
MSSEMARRRLTASFIRRGLNSGWRWLRVVRLRIVAPTADRHVDFADIKGGKARHVQDMLLAKSPHGRAGIALGYRTRLRADVSCGVHVEAWPNDTGSCAINVYSPSI